MILPFVDDYVDEPAQERRQLKEVLVIMDRGLEETMQATQNFRGSIDGIPSLTTAFRHSSARAVKSIDMLLDTMSNHRAQIRSAIAKIDEFDAN